MSNLFQQKLDVSFQYFFIEITLNLSASGSRFEAPQVCNNELYWKHQWCIFSITGAVFQLGTGQGAPSKPFFTSLVRRFFRLSNFLLCHPPPFIFSLWQTFLQPFIFSLWQTFLRISLLNNQFSSFQQTIQHVRRQWTFLHRSDCVNIKHHLANVTSAGFDGRSLPVVHVLSKPPWTSSKYFEPFRTEQKNFCHWQFLAKKAQLYYFPYLVPTISATSW